MTVTVETAAAGDVAEPAGAPALLDPAAAERQALIERWAERHGIDAARRLAEAEDLADAVAKEITPENTTDTYDKSWRVWQRFVAFARLPELEGSRGALVAFVTWMLREGQQNGKGYAPSSASTHLAAAVVGLRERGVTVSGDDQSEARTALEGLAVKLLQAGERRGRGQAVGGDVDGLRAIARACPDTLAGARDKALTLTGFHYASRSQDPAGLLSGDVTLHPRGLVVAVLTGKTKHSVRNAKIPYSDEIEICPVRAYTAYRTRLVAEHGPRWADPSTPAFVGIDQWGHVTGGMVPDSVTRAIKRISMRAGVPIAWTGHSLRIGLASVGRKKGKDGIAIADQGGWARHSRSMLGYMQRDDGWDDNASSGLT
ncbi:site-specific integrase [Streptomyces acidiscabies]|uniref:Integrase n=2 Tax=Streptomyces acidiscabies TaxID=42234 RepID=A0AAP6ELB6_9ACTN|nr:integrase [Streptomyces acidiscabies]MDX2966456.1 integrase [Streptomyces acidiscabies]MDX3796402.1 integrase [Streptomyces acidiscabies]